MQPTKGKLYLIPTGLGSENLLEVIPSQVNSIIASIDHYIVENEKSARKFIKQIAPKKQQSKLVIYTTDKHRKNQSFEEELSHCEQGISIGLFSDAGAPGIADPGASAVGLAHKLNIPVVPIVGSSSILLAMMASGLNGQNFAFNGYLPIKSPERKDAIKQLERKSKEINQSQLFIETPYRNNQFLNDLKQLLSSKTMLCVASNITMPDEFIKTKTIQQWKRIEVDLHKKPTIFIIHSYNIDTNRRFNQ